MRLWHPAKIKIMKVSEFNEMAKFVYDNTEKAAEYWGRTWGLGFWRNLWRYKQYELEAGGHTYVRKVGRVVVRHGSYQAVECSIDGKELPERAFLRALDSLTAEEKAAARAQRFREAVARYEEDKKARRVVRRRRTMEGQLALAF